MSWSYAWARRSKAGVFDAGDDATGVRQDGEALIVVVADGAGSAELGGVGARIACDTFLEVAASVVRQPAVTATAGGSEASPAHQIFQSIRSRVLGEAESRSATPMTLATTMVGAVLLPDRAFFLQIGDGAAVFQTYQDEYRTAIQPEETEFVNATFFVTSADAEEHVRCEWVPRRVEQVALFTDGLQPLVLHPTDHRPHSAFFDTVFRTLRRADRDEDSERWLLNMLASDMVTRRTDDDTSIVIARRWG